MDPKPIKLDRVSDQDRADAARGARNRLYIERHHRWPSRGLLHSGVCPGVGFRGRHEPRWLEAPKWKHSGKHPAGVVTMGTILEALLLARAMMSPQDAHRSSAVTEAGVNE